MESELTNFVYKINRECEALSHDIIVNICKRAIRKMNKQEKVFPARFFSISDDFPKHFSFFDILSVEIQSKYYDEINPHLQDYIENVIEDEYNSLSAIEKFVLDHSECTEKRECDFHAVQNKLFKAFNDILNEHWQIKKIQNFELTR